MPRVDWDKVAREYAQSELNMTHINALATQVAAQLRTSGRPFSGYTDETTARQLKARGAASSSPSRRRGFLKRLFGGPGDPVNLAATVHRELAGSHVGYWTLAQTYRTARHEGRKKIRYQGIGGMPDFDAKPTSSGSENSLFVLLSDGRLARFVHYADAPYAAGFISSAGVDWHLMSEAEVLLLDHRSRTVENRYNNRLGTGWEYAEYLSEDNYLLTGRKGGGCKKRLNALRDAPR